LGRLLGWNVHPTPNPSTINVKIMRHPGVDWSNVVCPALQFVSLKRTLYSPMIQSPKPNQIVGLYRPVRDSTMPAIGDEIACVTTIFIQQW
jgi:hypothetical protein